MIYPESALIAKLYYALAEIDADLERLTRGAGCPHCQGPLHSARCKPSGGPPLPDLLSMRLGLCCGHCRRRTLPPSILFLGREVYWGAVIVMIVAARQRHPGSNSACRLRAQFGVSWRTVKRWIRFPRFFPAAGAGSVCEGD